jgi:ATP-dependent exoDNAse (exonuclease V) alpha subunit
MNLSEEQEREVGKVIDLLNTPSVRFVKLDGRAGTGKTTCVGRILELVSFKRIVLAAPTNIAVSILQDKFKESDAVFSTVASLLKAVKLYDLETGKVWFEPTAEQTDKKFLIVIDESSMLSRKDANNLSKLYPHSKFLFIGDKGQLPPVDDERFCVLDVVDGGTLTENHRCGKGNELFDFIEALYQGKIYLPKESERIKYIETPTESEMSITYTNKKAKEVNNYFFESLYGSVMNKDVKLIARETFMLSKYWKIYNTETIHLYDVKEITDHSFNYYLATIQGNYDVKFSLDPKFEQLKEKLKKEGNWREYFSLQNIWKDIRLGYASTSHSVQGLTLPSVTLEWKDLVTSPDNIKSKLLYVAASRATDHINIIT